MKKPAVTKKSLCMRKISEISRAGRLVLVALSALLLASCSVHFGKTEFNNTPLKSGAVLPIAAGMYVALPQDGLANKTFISGSGAGTLAAGSGKATQKALQKALPKSSTSIVFANVVHPKEEQLIAAAKAIGRTYAVSLNILQWHDEPATIQVVRDRGEVAVSVYDADTGELLRMENLECSGSATTVNHIGAYGPQDCLEPAFKQWAKRVFGI